MSKCGGLVAVSLMLGEFENLEGDRDGYQSKVVVVPTI
jgi:hypothetical protein